jgi:hypothetical protein
MTDQKQPVKSISVFVNDRRVVGDGQEKIRALAFQNYPWGWFI